MSEALKQAEEVEVVEANRVQPRAHLHVLPCSRAVIPIEQVRLYLTKSWGLIASPFAKPP